MDKIEERRQLQRVFGAAANAAKDFEGPDFLITAKGHTILGVEVTAFYASNADAKLKRIPDYALRLIDRTQQVHRADKEHLKVDEVVIHDKDGSVKARATGIMQNMPSAKDRIDILFAKIKDKEEKAHEYLQHCQTVDLIIHDASNLFLHETHEDFYRSFFGLSPISFLSKTPFREIYLLTETSDNKAIYIPLVANAFIADCFAYEHLLLPEIEANRPVLEIFHLLTACLHEQGHHRVKVSSDKDGIGFLCGAWEMYYADEGKKVRDWMLHYDTYNGAPINEALADVSPQLREMAEALVTQRRSYFSAVDIRLPVHDA